MGEIEWLPFYISLKLAAITTFVLLLVCIPFAWWMSQTNNRFKPFIEAVVALPIVLPPTVIGFYILWAFSGSSALGLFLEETFGITLVFTFEGLVLASCVYSLPFMMQPLQSGFEALPRTIIEASWSIGKSNVTTLLRVALPNIRPALITAMVITFAHTVGEFGVVLMVGGSIPSETKVASIAIYEFVEVMDYSMAHIYAGIMVAISFIVLLSVYVFHFTYRKKRVGI